MDSRESRQTHHLHRRGNCRHCHRLRIRLAADCVLEKQSQMGPSRVSFRAWIKKHQTYLRAYAPDEIARLALATGFPLEEICPGVCDYVSHLKRLLTFWESPLADKWMKLTSYERGAE